MTSEQRKVESIKRQLRGMGAFLPGSLSKQYNVCGNPTCRCKDPKHPRRHGPYWQLSFTVNGPFLEVAPPTESIADYEVTGRYACIVERTYGKGRVVGFSVHPEGGLAWGGGDYNPYFYYDGKSNKTHQLLLNALDWVARKRRPARRERP